MTLYLTTDAAYDVLTDRAHFHTDAPIDAFASAWIDAAKQTGLAAGIDVQADTSGDVPRADVWSQRSRAVLIDAGLDYDAAEELLADLWQGVHDSVRYEEALGCWAADADACCTRGKRLARRLAEVSAARAAVAEAG